MRGVVEKRGQIWVETVIYTLIGLAVIGLVLAAALPKINQKKDEIVIEQSIEALGNIDDKIYEVQRASGNRRVVDLEIGAGYLVVDTPGDSITWVLDSSFPYSEVDLPVPLGQITVTTKAGDPWRIELAMNYSMNITFNGDDAESKRLDPAPTPYKLMIENAGRVGGNIVIDLSES